MKKVLIICNHILPNIGGMEQYIDNLINFFKNDSFEIHIYIDKPHSKKMIYEHTICYPELKIFYNGNTKLNFLRNKIIKNLENGKKNKNMFSNITIRGINAIVLLENKFSFNRFYNNHKNYNLIIDNTILNHKKLRNNRKAIAVIHAEANLYGSENFTFKKPFLFFKHFKNNIMWFMYLKVIKILNSWKTYETIVLFSKEDKEEFEKISKFKVNQKIFNCLSAINISDVINKKKYNPAGNVISILRFDNLTKNLNFLNNVSKNMKNEITAYGMGPDKNLLTNTIIKNPLLNHREKFEILNNASLFIMTSDTEGCPFSVIEAFSMGIPVILRDTFPNAKNLVVNNYNGLLFSKTQTPEIIAKEIEKLLNNKILLEKMSYNSHMLFSKKYTIECFNSVWDKIVKTII